MNKGYLLENNLRLWGSNLGINSSWESVGFGRSVRAERTGSPSGRTKNYIRITTDIRNYLKDIKITR